MEVAVEEKAVAAVAAARHLHDAALLQQIRLEVRAEEAAARREAERAELACIYMGGGRA